MVLNLLSFKTMSNLFLFYFIFFLFVHSSSLSTPLETNYSRVLEKTTNVWFTCFDIDLRGSVVSLMKDVHYQDLHVPEYDGSLTRFVRPSGVEKRDSPLLQVTITVLSLTKELSYVSRLCPQYRINCIVLKKFWGTRWTVVLYPVSVSSPLSACLQTR